MHIEELCTRKENRYLTVTLCYEEIRDIANGLYAACHPERKTDGKDYAKIAASAGFLFDMVKHGMVQPHTILNLQRQTADHCKEHISVTPRDIEVFEAYIQQNMAPDVFENANWGHSYALALECMREQAGLRSASEK